MRRTLFILILLFAVSGTLAQVTSEIRFPIIVRHESPSGIAIVVPPLVYLGERGMADLLKFEDSVSQGWTLAEARKRTPYEFTPASMVRGDGQWRVDTAEIAREFHQSIAPPSCSAMPAPPPRIRGWPSPPRPACVAG